MKILVVDDDRMMVRTICYILKSEGYETIEAFTGEEAVKKVKEDGLDCVLMDIKMPGINGVDALKMILDLSPDLPVVLMSAFTTDDLIGEAKKLGAYSVLTKPINIELILCLLSALRKEKSILIVDDDPDFCVTMSHILQAKGYQVESEVDPDRVLDHLDGGDRLVILLDLKLGTVNGVDILQKIRGKRPAEPVVLITAYREEMASSINQALQIGAYTCLYKPLEIEAVFRCIGELRRKKHEAMLGDTA